MGPCFPEESLEDAKSDNDKRRFWIAGSLARDDRELPPFLKGEKRLRRFAKRVFLL